MGKKYRIISLVCLGIVLAIVIGLLVHTFSIPLNANIYIFADIAECESLQELNNANGSFTKYTDTEQDKHLGDLPYLAAFSGEYNGDGCSFKIFSYTFENMDSAGAYFDKLTGKDSRDMEMNFSVNSGVFSTRIVVFNENRAYRVECPTNSLHNVLRILEEHFSITILKSPIKG